MSQHDELKRAAEAVKQAYADLCEHGGDQLAEAWNSAELAYDDAANPDVVLALIAENERLTKNRDMWRGQCDRQSEMLRLAHEMETQLKAENAGLKTGYQAYERVNSELKAEVEALRAGRSQNCRSCEKLQVGTAMGKGEQS